LKKETKSKEKEAIKDLERKEKDELDAKKHLQKTQLQDVEKQRKQALKDLDKDHVAAMKRLEAENKERFANAYKSAAKELEDTKKRHVRGHLFYFHLIDQHSSH